jgi:hypothetical protein
MTYLLLAFGVETQGPEGAAKDLPFDFALDDCLGDDGKGGVHEIVAGSGVPAAEVGEHPDADFGHGGGVRVGDDADDAFNATLGDDRVAAVAAISRDVSEPPQGLLEDGAGVFVEELEDGGQAVLGEQHLALLATAIRDVGGDPAGLELQLREPSVFHQPHQLGDCAVVDDALQVGLRLILRQDLPQPHCCPQSHFLFFRVQPSTEFVDLLRLEAAALQFMQQKPAFFVDYGGSVLTLRFDVHGAEVDLHPFALEGAVSVGLADFDCELLFGVLELWHFDLHCLFYYKV